MSSLAVGQHCATVCTNVHMVITGETHSESKKYKLCLVCLPPHCWHTNTTTNCTVTLLGKAVEVQLKTAEVNKQE